KGRPVADIHAAAKALCASVAATSRKQEENKYLDSRWKSGWDQEEELWIAQPLPEEFLKRHGARCLSLAFRELVRFVIDGKTDLIRSSMVSELRRALGDYLAVRGFDVAPHHAIGTARIRAKTKKPKTRRERIREQRNKFSRPRRTKGMPWSQIYTEYRKKYPDDETARPSTL